MIAVWIVATAFTLTGLLYSMPRYYKIFTCRGTTTGRVIDTTASTGENRKGIKAVYEYNVDGIRYEASTGYTTFACFARDMEYTVRYHPDKPQISFLNKSGMYINTALGTVFLFIGIGVFFVGYLLSMII